MSNVQQTHSFPHNPHLSFCGSDSCQQGKWLQVALLVGSIALVVIGGVGQFASSTTLSQALVGVIGHGGCVAMLVFGGIGSMGALVQLVKPSIRAYDRAYDINYRRLFYAAEAGRAEEVKTLLEAGLDKDARSMFGETPLFSAVRWGHVDVVKILLDAGLDKDARSMFGETPLFSAVRWGHVDVVKVLLDAGADKEAINRWGQTPLLFAIELRISLSENRRADVVRVLLEAGVNTEAKNNRGQTPFILAIKSGRTDLMKVLLEAGADIEAAKGPSEALQD